MGQGAETVSRDPKIAVDMERLVDLPGEGREQGVRRERWLISSLGFVCTDVHIRLNTCGHKYKVAS